MTGTRVHKALGNDNALSVIAAPLFLGKSLSTRLRNRYKLKSAYQGAFY
tara:strand:- start:49 stop:195 length:147 start_codon:yes stop_codon:yes gene_type:complete